MAMIPRIHTNLRQTLRASKNNLVSMPILFVFIFLVLCTSCSPAYTWGYDPTVHPRAAQAYIQAVMAKDAGDYEAAVSWYDEALRYTWSEKVARERAQLLQQTN